jgi:hypothetical protein
VGLLLVRTGLLAKDRPPPMPARTHVRLAPRCLVKMALISNIANRGGPQRAPPCDVRIPGYVFDSERYDILRERHDEGSRMRAPFDVPLRSRQTL